MSLPPKPCLRRSSTADTTLTPSIHTPNPPSDFFKQLGLDDPGLSRIFADAAAYDQLFEPSPAGGDLEYPGLVHGASEETLHQSLQGFTNLVGRDLNESDKEVSQRLAQLSVNNWASNDEEAPEDARESSDSSRSSSKTRGSTDGESGLSSVAEESDPGVVAEAGLEPEQIVDLLEQEFGALGEPNEEKLILETDGTLIQDVAILGVVHLTTHRIAFHASLLSSSPKANHVIKAGPVMVHRKGWHRKQMVWLELSHDMISSFPSSQDEHRIKPLRSILLSSVKDIHPDPKYPKYFRVVFDGPNDGSREARIECDTEEAVREWLRELKGAVYLYRRNRRAAITSDADDVNGVRINIPLSRLNSIQFSRCLSFATLASLTVSLDDPEPTAVEFASETHILQLAFMKKDPEWMSLMSLAEKARARQNMYSHASRVYIDFDPRVGLDTKDVSDSVSQLHRSLSAALALDLDKEIWSAKAHIHRLFTSLFGTFVVTEDIIGFWYKALTFGKDISYRIPASMVRSARPVDTLRKVGDYVIVLEIQGQHDLRFAFRRESSRDEAIRRINASVSQYRDKRVISTSPRSMSPETTPPQSPLATPASDSGLSLSSPIGRLHTTSILAPLSRIPSSKPKQIPYVLKTYLPKAINYPAGNSVLLKMLPKHFVCLTIGSRGDVQPYIALCLGLQKEGHTTTIVTHEEYKEWVEGFGVNHRTAGGDPGALMKLSVENKARFPSSMFSPQFFKESLGNFRTWLDNLLVDAWEQCKDADVLLESPSAMAGVHIAEALHIPYFRTFTMPWTKTRSFPHAFLSPPVESPTFNATSYVLFDNVFWTATSGQINRWRKNTLHIEATDMGHLAQSKIPFIYNFSPAVVPKPLDWGDATTISGYWFLDNPDLDWSPPASLIEFMEKARTDGKALVYIGFGSITVPDPVALTKHIIKAVLKSGVRAIISKGWSSRMAKADAEEVVLPEECYSLDKVPHDWLFPQIDAAVHHGGAGTTGASLRAGLPTLIRPWFGDQFFWASRVQKLGAGLKVSSLRSNEFADALIKATTDRVMKEKAASIGQRIREEDGVRTAIEAIYTWLPRAGKNRTELD
ncbi:hypothetical protein OF83DRAFT_1058536 [Amylostereum chailletii]|nr:hypothetical protein OF83DRAFT_1058536 [Amylostereum chailletii]